MALTGPASVSLPSFPALGAVTGCSISTVRALPTFSNLLTLVSPPVLRSDRKSNCSPPTCHLVSPSTFRAVSCKVPGLSPLGSRGFSSLRGGSKVGSCLPVVRAMADEEVKTVPKVVEKLGITIEKNPSESRITELSIRSWPKWGCPASKFPWTYDAQETCYLLKGKVKVYPEGSADFVEIGVGDLVIFPKGMSCTWEVTTAVDKHYKFES